MTAVVNLDESEIALIIQAISRSRLSEGEFTGEEQLALKKIAEKLGRCQQTTGPERPAEGEPWS